MYRFVLRTLAANCRSESATAAEESLSRAQSVDEEQILRLAQDDTGCNAIKNHATSRNMLPYLRICVLRDSTSTKNCRCGCAAGLMFVHVDGSFIMFFNCAEGASSSGQSPARSVVCWVTPHDHSFWSKGWLQPCYQLPCNHSVVWGASEFQEVLMSRYTPGRRAQRSCWKTRCNSAGTEMMDRAMGLSL